MNGRIQMQGGINWILPKEINAKRFFWDSYWLEIWANHLFPSLGGSVAMDSGDWSMILVVTTPWGDPNSTITAALKTAPVVLPPASYSSCCSKGRSGAERHTGTVDALGSYYMLYCKLCRGLISICSE
jgi:hypothetical protein